MSAVGTCCHPRGSQALDRAIVRSMFEVDWDRIQGSSWLYRVER